MTCACPKAAGLLGAAAAVVLAIALGAGAAEEPHVLAWRHHAGFGVS